MRAIGGGEPEPALASEGRYGGMPIRYGMVEEALDRYEARIIPRSQDASSRFSRSPNWGPSDTPTDFREAKPEGSLRRAPTK